jgi:hypothetical protein
MFLGAAYQMLRQHMKLNYPRLEGEGFLPFPKETLKEVEIIV